MLEKSALFINKLKNIPTPSEKTLILPWDMEQESFRVDLQDIVCEDDYILTIQEIYTVLKNLEKSQYFKKVKNEKEYLPYGIGGSVFFLLFLNIVGLFMIKEFRNVGYFTLLFLLIFIFGCLFYILEYCRQLNEKNHKVMLENREREFGKILGIINLKFFESKPFKFTSGPYGAWIEIEVEIKEKEKKETEKTNIQYSNFDYPPPPPLEPQEEKMAKYEAHGGSVGDRGGLPLLQEPDHSLYLPYSPPIMEEPEAEDEGNQESLLPILNFRIQENT